MSVASSFAESTPFLGVVSSVSLPPSAAAGLALSAAGWLVPLQRGPVSRPLSSCVPHRSCLIRWVLGKWHRQPPSMHQVFDCNWRDPLSFAHYQLTWLIVTKVRGACNYKPLGQKLLPYTCISCVCVCFGWTLSLQVEHTKCVANRLNPCYLRQQAFFKTMRCLLNHKEPF